MAVQGTERSFDEVTSTKSYFPPLAYLTVVHTAYALKSQALTLGTNSIYQGTV